MLTSRRDRLGEASEPDHGRFDWLDGDLVLVALLLRVLRQSQL